MVKSPLVVNENGNLMFFASVQDAERYLEPVDVRNGEYVAYDADGRRLDLSVESERVPALFGMTHDDVERVRVRAAGDAAPRPGELRAALLAFLRATGRAPAGTEGLSLHALVALAAEVGGTL